mmetsp:Transcript_43716/g.64897  ORF Transcript_43716/g.64897 Transcript_43716/m.64897 type:complete len:214 (-) Transcript_43716:255-896(-)
MVSIGSRLVQIREPIIMNFSFEACDFCVDACPESRSTAMAFAKHHSHTRNRASIKCHPFRSPQLEFLSRKSWCRRRPLPHQARPTTVSPPTMTMPPQTRAITATSPSPRNSLIVHQHRQLRSTVRMQPTFRSPRSCIRCSMLWNAVILAKTSLRGCHTDAPSPFSTQTASCGSLCPIFSAKRSSLASKGSFTCTASNVYRLDETRAHTSTRSF